MSKQRYLPGKDLHRVSWLNNFAAKKEAHASVFGFTEAQVESTKNDAAMWAYMVRVISQFRSDMKEFTAYKKILREGPKGTSTAEFPGFGTPPTPPTLVDAAIFERIGRDVATIKAHDRYTPALGMDFGIIGSESSFDEATFEAIIKAKAEPGQVRISFVKSETEGYHIYSRLKGDVEWQFLILDTHSPYLDKRPLADPAVPEVREYRGRGVVNDEEIGQFSQVVTVTFSG